MLHFRERGSGSENGPRLSLGNGATFVPKVLYFTARVVAGCSRFRAKAPYMAKFSKGVAKIGGVHWGP